MSQRFATRAAWSSLVLAATAALVTALATSGFASWLLQRAEDRRLTEAGLVLAAELKDPTASAAELEELVEEERAETTHMGLAFAVVSLQGQWLAGDKRLPALEAGRCQAVGEEVRACAVAVEHFRVISGGPHPTTTAWLLAAALLSTLLGAGVASFASRPLAAKLVAPLAQLEARLSTLDAKAITRVELGPHSSVMEVDSLRRTIDLLLGRVNTALTQATRFASDAAHELRTPLSTIRGELELVDGPMSAETLSRLRSTVGRLTSLVDRLLVLATPGIEGAMTELISFRDVVEDTLAALPPTDRARVTLELLEDFSLRGDAALISTMVSNALSNALKFGSQVTVRLAERTLRFDDDGPGVPASERLQVFEPLFRGAAARAGRVPGHGLGLALIAHVAQWHGGSASFEEVARGASLVLRFPATQSPEHA